MKKQTKRILAIIIILPIICVILTYLTHGGTIIDRPIDLSCLDDPNPARVEAAIEKATSATVIVKQIKGNHDAYTVICNFPERPDITCHVYLKRRDIMKIDVGDEITVRGNIKHYNKDLTTPYIVIGDAISVEPYTFDAALIKVTKPATNPQKQSD